MEPQPVENSWPEDLFLLYPKNRAYLANSVGRVVGSIPLIRLMTVGAMGMLFFLIFNNPKGAATALLTRLAGQNTQGTIQSCDSDIEGYEYANFSFQVQTGQDKAMSYTAEQADASCGMNEEHKVGAPVAVTYWPPDPSYARMTSGFDTDFSALCVGTTLLAFLVVIPLEVWTEWRKRYLTRRGRVIL